MTFTKWIAAVLGIGLLASSARGADLADVLGVAHVDGKYFLTHKDYVDEGADQVLATGSRTIKLYLVPSRYPWNTHWPAELHSLAEIAQAPSFRSVFEKPFHTYILTCYSVGRDDHYWTNGITPEQQADETNQFYELSKYLLTTYKGTGKTFVLQHWEGDWALRDTVVDGKKRTYDKEFLPTDTAVKAMIAWLNARQAGIKKARDEIKDTDVHLYGATECNRVEDSMAGKPGVANSVLPNTTVDLASYSAWNFQDTEEGLGKAVDYIAAHLPPTAAFGQNAHSVYLGEYGAPEVRGADRVNQNISNALGVVKSRGLPYAIFWEIYCNELKKDAGPPPVNGKDDAVMGYWMVKPDRTPGTSWHRYRRILATADPTRATSDAIKSKLALVFTDDFNRPDGDDLGPGWSQAGRYGIVNKRLSNHHMEFTIPSGDQIPWGSATLDLTNPSIAGHGLRVGDYFEVTLRRTGGKGMCGIELFDSDQLRQGAGMSGDPSPLQTWNGTTWVPISFTDDGKPLAFDWNASHTLGARMDSADGSFASFSYYVDGRYAGSWLIATGNKTLDKIGVYAQSDTGGASFEFSALKVYSASGNAGAKAAK